MPSIKSPLGAIGVIVVLVQAISAGALFAVRSQIMLQWILVIVIAVISLAFTILVIWLVIYLTHKNPAYLYSPREYTPLVQGAIFAPDANKYEGKLEDTNEEAI